MTRTQTVIKPNDQRIIWGGAVSVQHGEDWLQPWRLPCDKLPFFPPDGIRTAAAKPSGGRLRFATDAESLVFHVTPFADEGRADLLVDGTRHESLAFDRGTAILRFDALPAGLKTIDFWPCQTVPFRLRRIEIPQGAQFAHCADNRPRWITYGSSITHCGAADGPSCVWPGIVAREQGLNLTSLGFGGQCHLDPMVAKLIRDLPADLISVKAGINIYGGGSLSERSFLPALLGTIHTIREGHPDIPFVVCSAIYSPNRETTKNRVGFTLQAMRAEVEEAVRICRERGDSNLYYVDGLDLFGPQLAEFLPDNLHPNGEGYKKLAANFMHEVFDGLGIRARQDSESAVPSS